MYRFNLKKNHSGDKLIMPKRNRYKEDKEEPKKKSHTEEKENFELL